MLILAIDTSGDSCSLCLADGERPRSVFQFRHLLRLSERLPDALQFLLRDAGLRLEDVEAFAVGIGPGSFTGVRVGVTTAKTFAQVLERPLVGISSLDALAEPFQCLPDVGIVAVAPSRRAEVIAAFYRSGGGEGGAPLTEPAVIPTAEVVSRAAERLSGVSSLLLCGEPSALPAEPGPAVVCPASASAASVAILAARRLERQHPASAATADDPLTLTPLYVAPSPVG